MAKQDKHESDSDAGRFLTTTVMKKERNSKERVAFTVDLKPVPQPRTRFVQGRARGDRSDVAAYKQVVALAALKAGARPRAGPVRIKVNFEFARPDAPTHDYPSKGDLDNYLKAIWDALNGTAYHDDRQIVAVLALKEYAGQDRVGVVVEYL